MDEGDGPVYHVTYASDAFAVPTRNLVIDAASGSAAFVFDRYLADARRQARLQLGPGAELEALTANWASDRSDDRSGANPDGALSPLLLRFVFRSGDGSARMNVSYDTGAGLVPTTRTLPPGPADVLTAIPDPGTLLAAAEGAGGRALRTT